MKFKTLSYEERRKLFYQIKNICTFVIFSWAFLMICLCIIVEKNPEYDELTMRIFLGYSTMVSVLFVIPGIVLQKRINRITEKENEQTRLERKTADELQRKKDMDDLTRNALPMDDISWKQLIKICFQIAASPANLPASVTLVRSSKGSNFWISSNYYLGDITKFEILLMMKLDFFDRYGIYRVDINTDIQGKPVIIVNDTETYKVGH